MELNYPLIGVTAGVEWRAESRPYRPVLLSDSKIHDALTRYGCAPVLLPHEIEAVDLYCRRLDGVFIAGGEFQFPNEENLIADGAEVSDADQIFYRRASFELPLVRAALARDLPILGVCGGFQVLNAGTGGKLIVSLEHSFPTGEAHLVRSPDLLAHAVNADATSRIFRLAQQQRLAKAMPLRRAARRLAALGFEVTIDEAALARRQRFAGTDEQRLATLNRVADPAPSWRWPPVAATA